MKAISRNGQSVVFTRKKVMTAKIDSMKRSKMVEESTPRLLVLAICLINMEHEETELH